MAIDLKTRIYDVPDFPKPGIVFKDLTPLIQDAEAFNQAVDELAAWATSRRPDVIAGIESRGFLFAAAVARELRLGVTVIRKKGKLPRQAICVLAPNEYAVENFEMHTDAVAPKQRVLIVDDLIATGSSSVSSIDLVAKLGGTVAGFAAVVELSFLHGEANIRKAHPEVEVMSLVRY
jgi:adenine phosphoribosyltransferase